MSLSRRARCLAFALAAVAALGATPATFAAGEKAPLPVAQLAPGVYVHQGLLQEWQPGNAGDVANLGFIVGSRCVAVIDTGGTPAIGQRLLAAVKRATALPICHVINTHAHPDHVLGNVAFVSTSGDVATRFVGSARFGASLAARERHYLNALQRDFKLALPRESLVYPDLRVDGTLELDLGDRLLSLKAWPTAHTDHDLTVYDHQTKTLFVSDLLFVDHLPVIDGNLRGWLKAMSELKTIDVELAVPGHGAASRDWPAIMANQWNYLNTLMVETKAAIKARKTIREAVETITVPPGSTWQLADLFHRRNVTAAYAELEWED